MLLLNSLICCSSRLRLFRHSRSFLYDILYRLRLMYRNLPCLQEQESSCRKERSHANRQHTPKPALTTGNFSGFPCPLELCFCKHKLQVAANIIFLFQGNLCLSKPFPCCTDMPAKTLSPI